MNSEPDPALAHRRDAAAQAEIAEAVSRNPAGRGRPIPGAASPEALRGMNVPAEAGALRARPAEAVRTGNPFAGIPDFKLHDPARPDHGNGLFLADKAKQAYESYNRRVRNNAFRYEDCGDFQVIAYRGTTRRRDWVQDGRVFKWPRGTMDKVHKGFWDAFEHVEAEHLALLKKDKPIVITGHSLGGAIATIAAYRLKEQGYPVHSLTTFGSPRVGTNTFAERYEKAGIPTFRYVHAWDVVTRIPKIFYKHVGTPFHLHTNGGLSNTKESAKSWKWLVRPFKQLGKQFGDHSMSTYIDALKGLNGGVP